jgi:hypothetical protein
LIQKLREHARVLIKGFVVKLRLELRLMQASSGRRTHMIAAVKSSLAGRPSSLLQSGSSSTAARG